jgi:hypothetical protein
MPTRNRRALVLALAGGGAGLLAACGPVATPTQAPSKVAAAPGLDKLYLMVDVVQGSKNVPAEQAKNRSCVLSSRLPRNSEVVWRVRVHDPKTGEPMDDKALKSVQVQLANGKNVDAKWGPHPKDPPNELFWTASWVVPKDAPTGTLKYGVLATATDGRAGKFEPFPTAPSLLSVTEEVFADAPAKA